MLRSSLLLATLLTGCSNPPQIASDIAESYDDAAGNNRLSHFGLSPRSLDQIATSATVPTPPWSGWWWPAKRGYAANRWQQGNQGDSYRDYLYTPLTSSQAAALSEAQLARLSPAEKFDLWRGRLDFPLTRSLKAQTLGDVRDGEVPDWYGICHGWAAAATQVEQPGGSAVARLGDGRRVVFYAADLEALVQTVYADTSSYRLNMIGARCDVAAPAVDASGRIVDPACRDVNAGALHLLLADRIGAGKAVVADMSRAEEVWSYPIHAYSSRLGPYRSAGMGDVWREHRSPGTVYLVDVATTLYAAGGANPRATPAARDSATFELVYTLELDANERILGGEWRGDERPDFVWEPTSKPAGDAATLDMASVEALLEAARTPTEPDDPAEPDDPNLPDDPTSYPEALATRMLQHANSMSIPYLTQVVGMSLGSARAIQAFVVGPDRNRGTGDDRRIQSVAELATLASAVDVQRLAAYSQRNP